VTRLERALVRALEAAGLISRAEQQNWPDRHAAAQRLRPQVTADAGRRAALEKQFQQVQEEYERLARNAQGEIIKNAKLVATTLARFRTNKAVFEGPYDVVLVDEAGAATLPEVILATAKATRAAVLLGDFMQLGPVIEERLRDLDRPDVKRWLLPDVFQHCGIQDPADAQRHPACVTLTEQHRFGPAVMRLANSLAYGGMLQGGRQTVAPRPDDDPEIVLVDTDGLHELARPHLTGRRSGWWPAGALIARALVEYHTTKGEDTGIVTPYGVQAEATLEAVRDVESGGPLAEVGTAHRFQGREFPVVVFDTVEGADGRDLWMSMAHRGPGSSDWARNGVRLFNVAATRVQTRLYVIGSWERVSSAKKGTAFSSVGMNSGRSGLGPTIDMSPLSTSQSCGSSSRCVRRSTLPMRVTRVSSGAAHAGRPFS
jgi:superfamily I DNA and/or RNA helicase